MAVTIIGAILVIVAIIALLVGKWVAKAEREEYAAKKAEWNEGRRERYNEPSEPDGIFAIGAGVVSGIFFIGAALLLGLNSFYTQDVGEAKVVVTWDGKVAGQSVEPGLHLKAPWESVKTFDVRNNIISYVGGVDEENVEYAGNPRTGPQITFQDREGVSGDMDVTVTYALDPTKVSDIYTLYRTQESMVTKVINEAIRNVARKATVTRETIEVYNDRGGVEDDLRALLGDRITVDGFIIEEVSIQELDYGPEIEARFEEAQAARVAVDKAEAEQEAARVQAETAVVQAQGTADAKVAEAEGQAKANDLLTKSLSPEILQQRYIDALNAGTVFVVPEGSTPLVTTK